MTGENNTPNCCGQQMKKMRDTLYMRDRYKCGKCGAKTHTDFLQSLDANIAVATDPKISAFANENILKRLDVKWITSLRYENKILLETPDEKLSLQRKRRKEAVRRILGYWETIKGVAVKEKEKRDEG